MNVRDAIQLLKEHGYKNTDKRKQMLEFLASQDKYLTAKEVLEGMKADFPNLSFDTIYRNLALFSELGILEMTNLSGEKHFRFTCAKDEHHHHFICIECGKTKQLETCPMEQVKGELSDCIIANHKFEVYGYCNSCSPAR